MKRKTHIGFLLFATLVFAGVSRCRAALPPADIQLLDGLRARRLFSLAVLQCRQMLERPDLDGRQQADWVIELIRTHAIRAANSAPSKRATWWAESHKTAEQYLRQHAGAPFRALVQVQDALTLLAEGELARMEAEVATEPRQALTHARAMIRKAAQSLADIDPRLTRQIASAGREANDELTADELFSLQNHVQLELARAYRNQALCYPAGSDDRVAALSQAVDHLQRVLPRLQIGDVLLWRLFVDQAVCYRLIGDFEKARKALANPLGDEAPQNVRLQALAEQVRLQLATDHPEEALTILKKVRQSVPHTPAELDFVQLETYLALWSKALAERDQATARQWQQKATGAVAFLEQADGPYWGRRGELLLLHVAGRARGGANVEILERAAANLYKKGQLEEAIGTYEKAARRAAESKQPDQAFQLLFKAALIEQKDGHFAAAGKRFEKLSQQYKSHAKAPHAHLLAAWNMAQVASRDPSALEQYAVLLKNHVTTWPSDKTTDTARLWLGRLRENKNNWKDALTVYRQVSPGSKHFSEAIEAAGRCWLHFLRQQQANGQETEKDAQDAAAFFERVILGSTASWPERWSDAQRAAALAAARIRLDFTSRGYARVEKLLQTALSQNADMPDSWREEVRTLMIIALAGQQGRREEARRLLHQSVGGDPDRLLELVDSLSVLTGHASADMKKELSQLLLAALDQLKASGKKFNQQQKRRIARIQAEALVAAGRHDAGLQAFQQLAMDWPDDREIQLRFAQLLLDADGHVPWDRALDRWRRIARRLRPGTDDWYRAKYSVALAYFKLGKRAAAAERLQYLKATSQVAQTTWSAKVDQLLRQCQ